MEDARSSRCRRRRRRRRGEEEEKLILQIPAVDQGVSPASSENRGECVVQEQGDQSTGQCRIIWLIDRLTNCHFC
ncbi:hypothetical protein OsI_13193 [Oryza sativa Indica Group]|uniref:Uncharacterized protein n=1 Tax=Oryza sativa subsp. indica TaxID=39946 RepID=B8AQA5_ORYSI|nr:hypothetical protein OsI_13193 [Oryza sativa Indica Group]